MKVLHLLKIVCLAFFPSACVLRCVPLLAATIGKGRKWFPKELMLCGQTHRQSI